MSPAGGELCAFAAGLVPAAIHAATRLGMMTAAQ
jgi:hypothetical protein